MKSKLYLAIMLTVALGVFAQDIAAQKKTIVLVRHAEKDTTVATEPDPGLSADGLARALKLMKAVNKHKPKEIYSTEYKRTRQTAEPIAAKRNKPIQTYDPAKSGEFVQTMLASKTDRFLIVGHSNTTPALANLIAKKEIFRQLPDSEYGVIWVIRMKKGVMTKLEIYTY